MHELAQRPGQQVVVLSQVLAADVNVGYEEIVNTQVLALNGRPVHDMRALVAAAEDESLDGDFIRLDLEYNQVVILKRRAAREAMPAILEQHCIAADRSEDLSASGSS